MTEKRFTYEYGNLFDNEMNTFYPIEDSDENIEVLCDRLNWLVEENEQLKNMVRHSYVEHKRCVNNYVDKIKEVEKENEKLKSKNRGLQSELQIFKEDVTHSNLQINKLADENEELKHQNELLSDELEQCKAVINKKWSEYLKKKEIEND